jgi:hypothetical protein
MLIAFSNRLRMAWADVKPSPRVKASTPSVSERVGCARRGGGRVMACHNGQQAGLKLYHSS